jgi:hypothetical protein
MITRRSTLKFIFGATVTSMIVGCTETAAIHQEWGTVEEIVLEARRNGWVGIHPDIKLVSRRIIRDKESL